MTLTPFLSNFELSDYINGELHEDTLLRTNLSLSYVFHELGGKTFKNGLYRVYRYLDVSGATALVDRMFPENLGRFTIFGSDWSGRQFAIDNRRTINSESLVAMIDPGSGEIFQIDAGIIEFHNKVLIEQTNAALASDFFEDWYRMYPEIIKYDQCVGYIVPLFLDGKDTIDNLELSDMNVYLEICCQLWRKIQGNE